MQRHVGWFLWSAAVVGVLLAGAVGVSAVQAEHGGLLTGRWIGTGFDRLGRPIGGIFDLVQHGTQISGTWMDNCEGCALIGPLEGEMHGHWVHIVMFGTQAPDWPDCSITFTGVRHGRTEITGSWYETEPDLCDTDDWGTVDLVRQE